MREKKACTPSVLFSDCAYVCIKQENYGPEGATKATIILSGFEGECSRERLAPSCTFLVKTWSSRLVHTLVYVSVCVLYLFTLVCTIVKKNLIYKNIFILYMSDQLHFQLACVRETPLGGWVPPLHFPRMMRCPLCLIMRSLSFILLRHLICVTFLVPPIL